MVTPDYTDNPPAWIRPPGGPGVLRFAPDCLQSLKPTRAWCLHNIPYQTARCMLWFPGAWLAWWLAWGLAGGPGHDCPGDRVVANRVVRRGGLKRGAAFPLSIPPGLQNLQRGHTKGFRSRFCIFLEFATGCFFSILSGSALGGGQALRSWCV